MNNVKTIKFANHPTTKSSNTFDNCTDNRIDNGHSVVPIGPDVKSSHRFVERFNPNGKSGKWCDAWKGEKKTYEPNVMKSLLECVTDIHIGNVVAIDIDIPDERSETGDGRCRGVIGKFKVVNRKSPVEIDITFHRQCKDSDVHMRPTEMDHVDNKRTSKMQFTSSELQISISVGGQDYFE